MDFLKNLISYPYRSGVYYNPKTDKIVALDRISPYGVRRIFVIHYRKGIKPKLGSVEKGSMDNFIRIGSF